MSASRGYDDSRTASPLRRQVPHMAEPPRAESSSPFQDGYSMSHSRPSSQPRYDEAPPSSSHGQRPSSSQEQRQSTSRQSQSSPSRNSASPSFRKPPPSISVDRESSMDREEHSSWTRESRRGSHREPYRERSPSTSSPLGPGSGSDNGGRTLRTQQSLPNLRRQSHVSREDDRPRQPSPREPLPSPSRRQPTPVDRPSSPPPDRSETPPPPISTQARRPSIIDLVGLGGWIGSGSGAETPPPLPTSRSGSLAPMSRAGSLVPPTMSQSRRPSFADLVGLGGWIGASPPTDSETSPTSNDSGYSEGEDTWSQLKHAMPHWGSGETNSEASPPSGDYGWLNLAGGAPKPGDADDGSLGPDGDSKLGRIIKEYHISRASSPADVPDWVLNPAEKAAHAEVLERAEARRLADEADEADIARMAEMDRQYGEKPPQNKHLAVGQPTSYRVRRASAIALDEFSSAVADVDRRRASSASPSGCHSRASDRLKAMTDAKRHV